MRTRAVAATLAVLCLLSGPLVLGNECEKYICEQTVTEYGQSDPYCSETMTGMWVSCNIIRWCYMAVGPDGRLSRQCTPYNCEGEMCMWV